MEAAREQILEAETITREAQHDLMEIITYLRPAGTSDFSLNDRIDMIVDQGTGGFSLVSMRGRVGDLPHGTFEIKSTARAGTQIKLSRKNEL